MQGDSISARLERKLRVGKKRAIYLPQEFLEALGLHVDDLVVVKVEGDRIVIKRALDPFLLATMRRKWASTTVEEFEEESESRQENWNQ